MTGPLEPPGLAPIAARIEFEGDDHWELRGELVTRCRVLYDANELAVKLRAAPAPGPRRAFRRVPAETSSTKPSAARRPLATDGHRSSGWTRWVLQAVVEPSP
jgi:hypothetical protein